MARRGINAPFPMAPMQYSAGHMNRIIQTYSSLLAQLQTPGEMRGTTLTLTRLPTAAAGLAPGDIYSDAGTLKAAGGTAGQIMISMGTIAVDIANAGEDKTVAFTWS